MPKIKVLGPTVAAGETGTDRQTDGNVGNKYGLAFILRKESFYHYSGIPPLVRNSFPAAILLELEYQ